jgi:hypothetical protein
MTGLHLGGAQITIAAMYLASLCIWANKHGKTKTGTENFWIGFTAIAINLAVLWWGGFWTGGPCQ